MTRQLMLAILLFGSIHIGTLMNDSNQTKASEARILKYNQARMEMSR